MADPPDKARLQERLARLEAELAEVRAEVARVQKAPVEAPVAASVEAVPVPVPPPAVAAPVPPPGAPAPAPGPSRSASGAVPLAIVLLIGVAIAMVLYGLQRRIEPREPPIQYPLAPEEPLPTPPILNIPGPDATDPLGRQPGDPHYGHNHPRDRDSQPQGGGAGGQ